ncbi:Hypothetical predicted protein, partial [Paramuricea clavata]
GAAGGTLVTLTDGFVIKEHGHLKGDSSHAGLSIDDTAIINGEITVEKGGKITGGVVIGDATVATKAFPLRVKTTPVSGDAIALFTNNGVVDGGFTIQGIKAAAQKGAGASAANTKITGAHAVDIFHLNNTTEGSITGDITFNSSDLKFNLTNAGKITGDIGVNTNNNKLNTITNSGEIKANVIAAANLDNSGHILGKTGGSTLAAITATEITNTGTIKAAAIAVTNLTNEKDGNITATSIAKTAVATKVNNSGIIHVTAADKAIWTTNYKGESGSELHLNFSGNLAPIAGILTVTEATISSGSKIVLCSEGQTKASVSQAGVKLINATSGKITIEGGTITDILYTKAFGNSIIYATGYDASTDKLIKADLTVLENNDYLPSGLIPIAEVSKTVENSGKYGKAVTKAASATTTVGGVALIDHDKTHKVKKGVFDHKTELTSITHHAAKEADGDGHLFIDMVMPDCSSCHVIVASIITANGIVTVASATFKSGSKIVLCSENADAKNKSSKISFFQATASKLTVESTGTLLYTKKFTKKTGGDDYIIEATDTGITTAGIESVLTVKQIDDNIKHFFPNDPILVSDIATKFKNAHTINKAVTEASKTTVGGVALKTTDKKGVFDHQDKIADLMSDATEHSKDNGHLFIDMVMPDCSSCHVIVASIMYDKLCSHINARVSSKGIASNSDSYGITSGEFDENLGIWAGFSYLLAHESKNDDNQSYSEGTAMIFSLGADTVLNNDYTLGLSYSFNKSSNDIKGGLSDGKIGDRDINHHAISLYGAAGIEEVDINAALTYAFASHKGKDFLHDVEHGGGVFGINAAGSYALEVAEGFNLNLGGSLGFNYVTAEERENKYNHAADGKKAPTTAKTPKSGHSLIKLGIGVGTKDSLPVGDAMQFDYSVGVAYKFTHAMGDVKQDLTLVDPTSAKAADAFIVNVKGRTPSAHKCAIDASLGFRINPNIKFGIDLNLGIGHKLMEYGGSFVARYSF